MKRLPSVSEAIEFRQRELGWTQTRMAEALSLTTGHYSEIMHGKRGVPYRCACLAYALGVPAEILLNVQSITPKRANVYGVRSARRAYSGR